MNCGLSEKSWDKYRACHGRFEPTAGSRTTETEIDGSHEQSVYFSLNFQKK